MLPRSCAPGKAADRGVTTLGKRARRPETAGPSLDGETMSPRSNKAARAAVDVLGGESGQDGQASTRGTAPDDRIAFLRGFLAHPAQVGSIVPSSAALERRLVQAAGIAHARTVVELGPGTGGTTRALLRAMAPDARLLAIELSPTFHRRLLERLSDPRLVLHQGSAEQLGEQLARLGLPRPDAILSGIPFSTMPPAVAQRIAREIAAALAPGGRFVAYQATDAVVRFLSPHLGAPAVSWEWRNVPPLRLFRWTKPAAGASRGADSPA
jgi:phospholipid N-methyltransferase